MNIVPCNSCGEHIFVHERTCPHCNSPKMLEFSQTISGNFEERSTRKKMTSAAILLGLALSGCGDKGDDTATTIDRWTHFHQAVEMLSAEEKEVFQLVWYLGAEQKTIANLIGCSVRTVKTRWRHARESIRTTLNGEPPE